jgi:ribosome-binding protein aMBF1 (putative translation factor)
MSWVFFIKGGLMLGKNIKTARTRRGLTIKSLAAQVNVSAHIIRDMEAKGSIPRNIQITTLLKNIAKVTDHTITYLVTGETTQNSAIGTECQHILNSTNKIIKSL